MDDIKISSASIDEHIEHLQQVCEVAVAAGFEFKMKKGQFNQSEITLWGCICSATGRRADPKNIDQPSKWPVPKDASALTSFLAFVNYLRTWMRLDWIEHEQTLKPFRKTGV